MEPAYFERYEPEVIRRHIEMISRLGPDNAAEIHVEPLDDSTWRLTVVAFDYLSVISILSGLLASSGLSIRRGDVFTYTDAEPAGDLGVIEDVAELAAVGAGRVQADQRPPRPRLLVEDAVAAPAAVQVEIAADHRLKIGHRAAPSS
jgi:hypothetical protein